MSWQHRITRGLRESAGGNQRPPTLPPLPGIVSPTPVLTSRILIVVLIGAALIRFAGDGWTAHAAESDLRRDAVVEVVERVMPSVVNIQTAEVVEYRDPFADLFREFYQPYYRNRPRGTRFSLGSGVIIDEEGYILTNLHVVRRASKVTVRLSDGREFEAQPIVGTSARDVAILRLIVPDGEKFQAIEFGRDDDLLLGETVLALGNPFGLGGSVSRGILSSKNRRPALEGEPLAIEDWLQTDAAINPGSSGGPLVNLHGELIGLNVAVYREGQGIGFAIPVKQVIEALSQIFTPEVQKSLWFGATIRWGSDALQVTRVDEGSPAAEAGLKVGDQVLQVDGTAPRSFIHCMLLLASDAKQVELQVRRDGDRRELTVKPRSLQDLVRARTGITLQEMDALLAQQFGLAPGQGLLVTDVERDSPAATARFEPGLVVASMDDRATTDLLTAAEVLGTKKKGDKVVFGILVEERRRFFSQLRRAQVEIEVR